MLTNTKLTQRGALDGVRVFDLTWAAAGPIATSCLANFGAQVIKVESKTRHDMTRLTGPFKDGIPGVDRSPYFAALNTSKYDVTLDLTNPEGLRLARSLIAISDVVAENFRPGVIAKLGLSYEELKRIKPDIVLLSLSIMGQTGTLSNFAGYGPHGGAISGFFAVTGWPDRGPTSDAGLAVGDYALPMAAVSIVIAALDYRNRTGIGQLIDASQVEVMSQLLAPAILDYTANGRQEVRQGNRSQEAAPHGAFPCRGEDTWCAIAVFTDEQWRGFCQAIGDPPWCREPRFGSLSLRKQNEDELERLVGGWTVQHSPADIMLIMQGAGVPCGVVQNAADLLDRDPQLKHRGTFVQLSHPAIGEYSATRSPAGLSRTPAVISRSPMLSEHTQLVLQELLGVSDSEFKRLGDCGALG